MFTTGDDVPLVQVLEKLHGVQKGAGLDPKASEADLFAKLGEALPEHDRERIYPSDVRKLFTWYGLLVKSGEFDQKEEPAGEEKKEGKASKTAKKAPTKEGAAKKVKADGTKTAAPKPGASSKPKASTMRKSAQRGS